MAAWDADQFAAEFLGTPDVDPAQGLASRSIAVLPLVEEGRLTAAFSLAARADDVFTESDRIVFEDLARRIRLVMDRVELYRQAQEASRLKDEFLSTLSHELRTPLNAIFGWIRILRTRQLDDATAHGLAVIDRNTEAQIRLIEEVLDVSRVITGKMALIVEPVDVRATLGAAIDAARPGLDAKGIQLTETFKADVPLVFADPHRLQQVFWNLLSNALKFTPAGGAISVTLSGTPQYVDVQLSDTGVGIRRDVLPFVFDRFRQADSSTTRRHGGLGLGLAIVRHIVELHGGTVHAESPGEGQGATFTVHLPAERRTKPPAITGPERAVSARPSSLPLSGRTILIVEDHDDARDLIGNVLQSAGARVLLAASSSEALQHLAGHRPDALVADIGLPGEDGYAMLQRIRALAAGAEVPAIALTAYARAADRERALAVGFREHLVKPVDPQVLLSAVRLALGDDGS
jgi:signal transduction histidine kinase/CheY-like chemotaxis protein